MKTNQTKKLKISNMLKRATIFGAVVVLMLSNPFTAQAQGADFNVGATSYAERAEFIAARIGTRPAAPRRGASDMVITGYIPHAALVRADMTQFNDMLNDRFADQRDEFILTHRSRTPDLHFDTSVYTSGHYVSVVVHMHAAGLNETNAVATTVINAQTLEIITITDFNPNMIQIVNNRLNDEIAQNPRGFVTNFSGIDNSHPFYLSQDALNVPFASGALHSVTRDIVNITFHDGSIQNEVIERPMFRTLPEDAYSTIMVRFIVAEYFGYAIGQMADSYTLSKGHLFITITVGRNAYFLIGKEARTLELAPMYIDGEVYVPLSFFREMLGLSVTVTSPYEILISKWQSLDTTTTHLDTNHANHQMN